MTASSDMGDLSHIMPTTQPFAGGAAGIIYGNNFVINDYIAAILNPAKVMAMTIIDLLVDDAPMATKILAQSKLLMTKQE